MIIINISCDLINVVSLYYLHRCMCISLYIALFDANKIFVNFDGHTREGGISVFYQVSICMHAATCVVNVKLYPLQISFLIGFSDREIIIPQIYLRIGLH